MMGNRFTPRGKYVILVEKEENGAYSIYSTDSPFWRDFFR